MRSYIDSGWSAATQVKAVSPDICIFAVGQGLVCSEASIAADVIRRVCSDLPGSQAVAGHPTDCIGTWDSRIACMPQQAAEVRRGLGDTAVGPAHSRGVAPSEPQFPRSTGNKLLASPPGIPHNVLHNVENDHTLTAK